jgi:dihydropteroate synthase
MHNRENVDREIDIVEDMLRFFERSLALAEVAGVPRTHVLIDPGIGFGKSRAQNLAALKATDRLKSTFGLPVLIGVSRKRMFGEILGAGVDDRLIGTLAANLATLARGANVFRVHDAAEHRAALSVYEAIANA